MPLRCAALPAALPAHFLPHSAASNREAPNERLGSMADGFKSVRKHRWFKGLDWKALTTRQLPSPITPVFEGKQDTRYGRPGAAAGECGADCCGRGQAASGSPTRFCPASYFEPCDAGTPPKAIGPCSWDAEFRSFA